MTSSTNDKPLKDPILGNKSYDFSKDLVTIYIPSAVALYSGLALLLGLPYSTQVVGVGALLVTFLGSVLKVSSNRFQSQLAASNAAGASEYNGALVVNMTDPNKDNYQLQIDQPWDELSKLNEVRIKVIDESGKTPSVPDTSTGAGG